ncbi:unnamed protein product [Taenia asiatica]|uniref:Armadillo repeat-containing protein 8 n=1 Tax=Taenia asiatica TaxID=60517 RepID=A0A0R3WD07_TAEAS|nr:unnamed protein product [Taenia asiatica]
MRPSQSREATSFMNSTCASQNSLFLSDTALSLSRSLKSLSGLGKPESAVQRLSPCIENLTKAIGMIINFKDDAYAAAANVPKLTRLLDPNSSTPENHYNACVILHKLSEKEASRNSLAYYPQVIESLVRLLQTTQDINTQTEAVLALRKLCYAKPAISAVRNALSTPNLVDLLSHPTETIFLTSLSILHRQMLLLPDTTRPEVKECGGPVQLVSLLTPEKIPDPAWLTVCADAIRMTAYEDAETKLILLDCDIAEKIVYLLNTGPKNEKLQHALARLVKVLSVSTECKQGLVEAGAVQALTQLLNSKHNSLILETLWGLRNLSDQAFHLTDTRDLLKLLVPLVSSSVEHIAICSIGCLCNLTCQNATNKATLIEIDGVRALCSCLTAFLNRDEVTEPVCSALRNLTHQNEHASLAIRQIHDFGVLKTIVGLLKSDHFPEQLPLVKAVIGLIRNLGLSKSCRRDLQEFAITFNCGLHRFSDALLPNQLGTTDRLIVLFQRTTSAYEDAIRQRSSILSAASDLSYIEGVRLEDLVELLLVALQSMAQHSAARTTIIGAPEGVFASFVQYLYSSSEYLQRASLSLLSEVSVYPEGSQAIEHEGAIARITELVHSSDSKIATYSASILHRTAAHLKSVDYQMRLSQELKKSLRDSGVLPTKETPSEAATVDRLPDVPEQLVPKPRSRTTLNEVNNVGREMTHENGRHCGLGNIPLIGSLVFLLIFSAILFIAGAKFILFGAKPSANCSHHASTSRQLTTVGPCENEQWMQRFAVGSGYTMASIALLLGMAFVAISVRLCLKLNHGRLPRELQTTPDTIPAPHDAHSAPREDATETQCDESTNASTANSMADAPPDYETACREAQTTPNDDSMVYQPPSTDPPPLETPTPNNASLQRYR